MSQADAGPSTEDLLQQGKEAARAGDKATARVLLEQVVSKDQNSEQGWFWLAAVVDDLTEKRTCLGNVLVVNPNNEKARRLLDQLPSSAPPLANERAALLGETGGTNHRTLTMAAGLGLVGLLIILVALVALSGGDGDKTPNESPPFAQDNPTASPDTGGPVLPPTRTLPPDVTLTPRPTSSPPPPTWTPKPSNTPLSNVLPTVFPPAPPGLPGQIIMRAGQFMSDSDNQPIELIKPDGSGRQVLTQDARGHAPILSPDGSRFAYIRYSPGMGEFLLQLDTVQGTAPIAGSAYWANAVVLLAQDTPAWSPDGSAIVFTAVSMGASDLYRVSLLDPNGSPDALQRLTSDNAAESWPAWSPDGQRIVYAADLSQLNVGGATDLQIFNTASSQITTLTTDGAALVESAPDWSPDGQWIVFQATQAGSAKADIYRIPATGGAPEKIIASDADDILPRFSPDGRYVVFSSDRSGNWDVYIYEIATNTYYQVTTTPAIEIANDWGR
jgi:hypothetical protein